MMLCTLCGTDLIPTLDATILACRNCDLYPYISQTMSKTARMNQQSTAQAAVTDFRRRGKQ